MRALMIEEKFDPDFDYPGFADRLAETMFPEKVTAFAARSGVPQGTLSKYLKAGGTAGPRLDLVAKIADALGCSIDWLVWGRGDGPEAAAGFVKIPRYDATLAAGAGSWNEGRRQLDFIPFTNDFLAKRLNRTSAKGLTVLEARGDSMEPTIADGGLLLVDEDDRRVVDGIFAFLLDGDARVKRIRKLTDGLMLISDNTAYPPETVLGDELGKLQIIGRVRWVGQTL
jgi:transcriptional regulator with XRE-family HTH domain